MTRTSNEVNDLFKGYTLNLMSTSNTAVKISSSQNLSTIEGLLNDFISSYNLIYGGIQSMSMGGANENDGSGPLAGDSLARQIQRDLRNFSSKSITGYEDGPYTLSLLGVSTQRDGTLGLNTNTLKNVFEKQPKVVDAVFKNQLITDTAEVEITAIGTATQPGNYAISKSGSDFQIDGVNMTLSDSIYTSGSGNSAGLKLKITDTNITSANVYYGKSLMTLVEESLTNILAYDGDIQNRLKTLSSSLKDLAEQKTILDQRMEKLTQRYAMQYASMETSVAGLKDTGDYLTEMLKSE